MFDTISMPGHMTVTAPDGSRVSVLVTGERASMAHFAIPPGQTSVAVKHREVDELWYVVGGEGEMWRELDGNQETVILSTGTSLSIPAGTRFQFRSVGQETLAAVGVTVPPWPTTGDADLVEGIWEPTLEPGPH